MNAQIDHYKGDTGYSSPPSEMTQICGNDKAPSNPFLHRKAPCSNSKMDFVIIENTNGIIIKEVPLPEGPLQIANLPAGNYIISTITSGKVIRERVNIK